MARNQNSGTWNQNHRYSQSDDSIMRRGDDRTIDSQNYDQWQGQGQSRDRDQDQNYSRNSYRGEDYPTDKPMNRWGSSEGRGDQNSSFSSYDGRNYRDQQNSRQQNFGFDRDSGSDRNTNDSYGWSSDYRSSQDYRPSHDHYRPSESMRGGSFGSSAFGTGGTSVSSGMGSQTGSQFRSSNWGAGSTGSQTTQFRGQHFGKGPKNYRRSDDRIREEVSEVLERDPHIDASELEVEVKEGLVTLRGHVEDRHTKRMTEDLVMGVYGVKDVRNELTVDQSIFTQARNLLFGESVESQSASSSNSNRSTTTKSKH